MLHFQAFYFDKQQDWENDKRLLCAVRVTVRDYWPIFALPYFEVLKSLAMLGLGLLQQMDNNPK